MITGEAQPTAVASYFQEGELRGHDVSNAWEVLEQSRGTHPRAHRATWHGEEENWAAFEQNVTEVSKGESKISLVCGSSSIENGSIKLSSTLSICAPIILEELVIE